MALLTGRWFRAFGLVEIIVCEGLVKGSNFVRNIVSIVSPTVQLWYPRSWGSIGFAKSTGNSFDLLLPFLG